MDSQKLVMVVVEDDEVVVNRLKRRFVGLREKEPKFEFMNVPSFDEYLKLQKDYTFNVVIIDMRLWKDAGGKDADEKGGLKVARKYRVWNPGAVAIIYTAYPELRECVKVMRCNAWDYIDKNERDSLEKLINSVEKGLEERFPKTGPTSSWLEQELPELVEKYAGQYVAFVDQILVDSDCSEGKLRERVKRKYVDKEPFFLQVL